MSSMGNAGDLFQENTAYQHAGVLLYDRVSGSRQATRSILFNLGFRDITMVARPGEFSKELESDFYDLVVADLTDEIEEVCGLVSRIRKSDLGANPFQVIILTSFELDAEGLGAALDSGADDLLIRPLSNGMIQRRVKTLVEARKDFVVASDYIGPDRRSDPDRPSQVELVKVPNSLRDRVEKGPNSAGKTAKQIAVMREQVAAEHLHRMAVTLGVEAHRFRHAELGSDEALDSRDCLETISSDINRRLGPDQAQAASMITMLINVLAGTQKVHPDRQAELIHQLALGVGVAVAGLEDEAALSAEVEATVEKVNARHKWTDEQPNQGSSAA